MSTISFDDDHRESLVGKRIVSLGRCSIIDGDECYDGVHLRVCDAAAGSAASHREEDEAGESEVDYIALAVGDYCSYATWIEDIEAPKDLEGAEILEAVRPAYGHTADQDEGDEVLDIWIEKIATSKGIIDIEMRCSHNGYYGGYLVFSKFEGGEYFNPQFQIGERAVSVNQIKMVDGPP